MSSLTCADVILGTALVVDTVLADVQRATVRLNVVHTLSEHVHRLMEELMNW